MERVKRSEGIARGEDRLGKGLLKDSPASCSM